MPVELQVRLGRMEWIVWLGWRDLNSRPLDPQIGSVSKEVPRRLIFLTNKDFTPGCISVDKPKWWSKWWSDP